MTADERIKQLLKRAGYPMMHVRQIFPPILYDSDEAKYSELLDALDLYEWQKTILDSHYFEAQDEMRHMVDTIDRLEAALENALNERDALHADFEEYVKRVIGETGGIYACTMCKHYCSPDSPDFFERECPAGCKGFNHWEWSGVRDREDANE